MNKYEKVRLDLENSIRKVRPAENFSEVIDEYAKKGYRFKQLFAPTGKNGTPKYYDIIFEKIEDGKVYIYDYLQIEVDHKAKNDLLVSDYWEDVIKYELKGWNFVAIFAPASLKGGLPKYYELVFEKQTYAPPTQEFIPQYQDYDYQRQYLDNQQNIPYQQPNIPYQQPQYIEDERPSEQKNFNLPTGQPLTQPINPYITQEPVVNIDIVDTSHLNNQSNDSDIIRDLPMFNIKPKEEVIETTPDIETTPAFPKPNFEEEKIDRYENKEIEEEKPKFIFKDEITNEIIDKDYAKRFFNQIGKNEEKVPMKAKPTNVGFVDFEDDEELS